MGQKVNPVGMRIGITRDWTSNWYADKKDFADRLNEDLNVRQLLQKRLKGAAVSRIQIERPARNAKIIIHSARPGVIIGKKGGEIEALCDEISKVMKVPVHITIEEVRKPELDAKLVAENIAQQLERRVMFRRAMKRAVQNTLRQGALGVKISVSGRLGGAEIARTEWYREGRVPLHTFRADIDYATASAKTTYGIIGVKVWIFKGEVHAPKPQAEEAAPQETEEEVK
ncbi:30S ribosomal protein S3 [Coxiella burnetii]|uniref:30S ribosomal protein S3 n=1 Tax=Coxiella burnetii TaxID=777 RepID=UPI0002D5F3C5|nr:30S ribosomal protein S3 [Coxiella burnetii]AML47818.1 30S ribosomal protein S3 [Coxiella burnetii]AML53854.1 30S ribosomal protein S3 [Coxiella burnetii]ATN67813.1 30S ribosomal protein S3 [Coxiella burnetii]ATN69741.1 30S ribosomal protein S3 [Coxiella burnetii]ATN71701.1 30S ribosomal protein S3 [Coxiella burnetii]